MDDMWSIEAWDKMRFFFPDYNNGSRVLATTRLSNLAAHLTDSDRLDMTFLDERSSSSLFSKTVFGEESFPAELKEIGKKIVENCRGLPLPLSIAVIGGLLAKSHRTQEYSEHVEETLKSILNSENDGDCMRILKMSYNHLPTYLKPCFLYMGLFEEDRRLSVPSITKQWVSEGFLKPADYKDLETIAREYLKELVDRNLVLVHESGLLGNLKYCKMHDLLRDLALKEAQKQRFYYVLRKYDPRGINSQRRIVIPQNTSKEEVLGALKSMTRARSYLCHNSHVPKLPESRLLRTLSTFDRIVSKPCDHLLEHVLQFVNSRYLDIGYRHVFEVLSSIKLLWNLHTLNVYSPNDLNAPIEIWKMHHLRHVNSENGGLYLPDPPLSNDNGIVTLENLQSIKGVRDLNLNEEVVNRIPNIKRLKIEYSKKLSGRVGCLNYLQCLSKLEVFQCSTKNACYLHNITFPNSLKSLSLETYGPASVADGILEKISSLLLLHKLKLGGCFFRTHKWEITQDQFQRLRSLELYWCHLQEWTLLESSCFPLLQVIYLDVLQNLNEIPTEIGEIPTLKSIRLDHCSESTVLSAKKIVEEQEDLQGEQLDFRVRAVVQNRALESLASPNFEVIFLS